MMKILLILPRYELALAAKDFNFGFGYLCSVLRASGFEVEVLNTDPQLIDRAGIIRHIREAECDLIGVGGLSIAFTFLEWLIAEIRRLRPETPVVLGGGILSARPELIHDHLKPDFGVIGEGELTTVELLRCLLQGEDPETVKGIIFRKGGRLVKTPARGPILDLDALPYPAWDDLQVEWIIQNGRNTQQTRLFSADDDFRQMSVLASRSCPFLCSFCFHPLGNRYRKRSPGSVVAEMQELVKRYAINYFRMADELFVFDREWVNRFCSLLMQTGLQLAWECNGKVGHGDPEMYALMKASGCVHISHGFESGNDRILKNMNKKFRVSQARQTIEMVRAAGIDTTGGFIIGTPGETEQSIGDTVRFIQETDLPVTWFGFITPYPGTRIYHQALDEGLIQDEIAFHCRIWNTQDLLINFTDMPDEKLIALKEKGLEEIYRHLIASSREELIFAEQVHEDCSRLKMKCRYCGAEAEYLYAITNTNNNILICSQCSRKKLLDPYAIPHIRAKIDRFRSELARITQNGNRIAVSPVGEHTKRLLSYIDWEDLNLVGFLDGDPSRVRNRFLGRPVYHRSRENLRRIDPDYVLMTGQIGVGPAVIQDLIDCGVPQSRIISFGA